MVDHGWKTQEINDNPEAIAAIGSELFNHGSVLVDNYRAMRLALNKVVQVLLFIFILLISFYYSLNKIVYI
jgi:DNA anti-recombination protein RmuC